MSGEDLSSWLCATILVPLRQRSVLPPRRRRNVSRFETRLLTRAYPNIADEVETKSNGVRLVQTYFCLSYFLSSPFLLLLFFFLGGIVEILWLRWNQEEGSALNRCNKYYWKYLRSKDRLNAIFFTLVLTRWPLLLTNRNVSSRLTRDILLAGIEIIDSSWKKFASTPGANDILSILYNSRFCVHNHIGNNSWQNTTNVTIVF